MSIDALLVADVCTACASTSPRRTRQDRDIVAVTKGFGADAVAAAVAAGCTMIGENYAKSSSPRSSTSLRPFAARRPSTSSAGCSRTRCGPSLPSSTSGNPWTVSRCSTRSPVAVPAPPCSSRSTPPVRNAKGLRLRRRGGSGRACPHPQPRPQRCDDGRTHRRRPRHDPSRLRPHAAG